MPGSRGASFVNPELPLALTLMLGASSATVTRGSRPEEAPVRASLKAPDVVVCALGSVCDDETLLGHTGPLSTGSTYYRRATLLGHDPA
jgi:hypothetical protein